MASICSWTGKDAAREYPVPSCSDLRIKSGRPATRHCSESRRLIREMITGSGQMRRRRQLFPSFLGGAAGGCDRSSLISTGEATHSLKGGTTGD
ncbi:MAG: hypothetical protein ACLSIF_06565 [Faecalimonas umbilicata]